MQQLNFNGKTKEQEAIEFIRSIDSEGQDLFVGYSGGKDSEVLLDLVKRSGRPFQAFYSFTGVDAPELVRHVKTHPEVKICRPKESFFSLIPKKGYPTKWTRWCCDAIKKNNTKHIPLKHRLMGIRAEESSRRASRPMVDYFGKKWIIYKPIFHWLEWEVWDFIEAHNLPYCSLYDEGFNRLGCVVCPFVNGKKLEIHKARWPKIYAGFEKAMKKLWDTGGKKDGTLFKESTFEEFLSNWYKGK